MTRFDLKFCSLCSKHWDDFWVAITLAGDPKYAFLFIYPLFLLVIDRRLAYRILAAIVASDVMNAWLKWPLAGDRPFWVDSRVREFWMTCESGFGNPSGHVMVSTAVWVTVARAYSSRPLKWAVGIFVFLVGVSRVHIGAHFPEQALAGAVCGWAVVLALERIERRWGPALWGTSDSSVLGSSSSSSSSSSSPTGHVPLTRRVAVLLGAAVTVVVVTMIIFGLVSLQRDPLHSMVLAHQGCDHPEGVHSTTSPFVGVFRDAGVLLGAAMGLALVEKRRARLALGPVQYVAACAVVFSIMRLFKAAGAWQLTSPVLSCVLATTQFAVVQLGLHLVQFVWATATPLPHPHQ